MTTEELEKLAAQLRRETCGECDGKLEEKHYIRTREATGEKTKVCIGCLACEVFSTATCPTQGYGYVSPHASQKPQDPQKHTCCILTL